MATYSQVGYGSSGGNVKKLQELLNSNGYSLDVDGVYGSKTKAAVTDYQKKNKLTVDGIAGDETFGSLNKVSSSGTSKTASQSTDQVAPDYSEYSYDAGTDTAYQQALAALQQATAALPTYQASYDDQLQEIYDKIVNREKFSYDLNGDALYQQYADQYQLMGQQAMMDTMGQAAALTGGYGNSYATTAGNQAYQAYLQQLNDVVPELYGMALDQYNAEGDAMYTQYAMLGDMADDEYGKYQDALSQYWQNVSYQKQNADDAYDRGYNNYLNAYQMGVDADSTAYDKQQDAYNNLVNLITSTGYTPTAEELQASGMSDAQATAYADYYLQQTGGVTSSTSGGTSGSTSGSTSSGNGSSGSYNNGGVGTTAIKQMQKALGVTADGYWGEESRAAAKAKYGISDPAQLYKKLHQVSGTDTGSGGNSGFTGTTYSEAVAYMKAQGVPSANASTIYTASEWERRKNSGGSAEAIREFNSYAEYLEYAVDAYTDAYGKG